MTTDGVQADCQTGQSGALGLPREAFANWVSLRTACQARCLRCERCRFVSFSLEHSDCSWYSSCQPPPPGQQLRGAALWQSFRTVQVRSANATTAGATTSNKPAAKILAQERLRLHQRQQAQRGVVGRT